MTARSGSGSVAGWLRRLLREPEVPWCALEVRSRSLGFVRLRPTRGGAEVDAAGLLDLPESCLRPSMSEPNIREPGTFAATLEALFARGGRVGGVEGVCLVLPDTVVRTRLLDPTGWGDRDRDEHVRYELRSAVPFDIRTANVGSMDGAGGRLVAAAVSSRILAEYEGACRAAGLDPGWVTPSSLALAFAPEMQADGDQLLVNWDEDFVSFLITRSCRPLLVRTLAGDSVSTPGQIAREAVTTVTYYREKLGGGDFAGRWLRCCHLPQDAAASQLERSLGSLERLEPFAGVPAGHAALAAAVAVLQGHGAVSRSAA